MPPLAFNLQSRTMDAGAESLGWHTLPIRQGEEMGRPSTIGLEIQLEAGKLAGVRIAGKAVKLSEGVLYL